MIRKSEGEVHVTHGMVFSPISLHKIFFFPAESSPPDEVLQRCAFSMDQVICEKFFGVCLPEKMESYPRINPSPGKKDPPIRILIHFRLHKNPPSFFKLEHTLSRQIWKKKPAQAFATAAPSLLHWKNDKEKRFVSGQEVLSGKSDWWGLKRKG